MRTLIEWAAFNVFLIVLVAIDLGVFSRKAHIIHVREAMIRSAIWVAGAFAFAGVVFLRSGPVGALNYVSGYLVEEVLSVDNLFVMLIIFSYFQVPRHHQHRVLLWGIFGALVMRGVFIVCGVELIERFHWLLYPLGALLIYTALKLLVSEEQYDPEHNWFLRFSRRYLPVTKTYHRDQFFARVDGRLMMTPLFVVLWVINTTDLLFAIDSVPAVIGVVNPPDAFIVYSSNAFAIVGLRSLYFALAGMMDAFHYLRYGLFAILTFVGVKMLIDRWVDIPNWAVLSFVGGSLAISIGASLLFKKPEPPAQPEGEALSTPEQPVETAR
jgi:tellurite resistance protein TerC